MQPTADAGGVVQKSKALAVVMLNLCHHCFYPLVRPAGKTANCTKVHAHAPERRGSGGLRLSATTDSTGPATASP